MRIEEPWERLMKPLHGGAYRLAVFIRAWQTAPNLDHVCEHLHLTKSGASNQAAILRKKGVPLKTFSRGRETVDYTALAELAASFQEGEE